MRVGVWCVMVLLLAAFTTSGQGNLEQTFIRRYNLPQRQGGLALTTSSDGGFIATGQHLLNGAAGECDVYVYKVDVCGNRQWFNLYGTPESEGGKSIESTEDGGVVIAGAKTMLGQFNSGQAFVMKLAADGSLDWHRYITEFQFLYDVQPLASGYIAVGQSHSTAALVRLDDAGNVVWARRYPALSEVALKVIPLNDGGFFFVTNESFSGSDVQAARVDAAGNILWQRSYGSGYVSFSGFMSWATKAIVDDVQEEAYILGSTATGGFGDSDILLLRVDLVDGHIIWSRAIGSAGKDVGRDLIFVPGGIAVVGSTDGFGGTVAQHPDALVQDLDDLDILLFKVSNGGYMQWARTYGGDRVDKGIAVRYDDALGYTISAHTYSDVFGTTPVITPSGSSVDSMDPLFIRAGFDGAVSCQNIPIALPNTSIAVVEQVLPYLPAPWTPVFSDSYGYFQGTVTENGVPLQPGDWVAAFDAADNCIGVAQVQLVAGQSRIDMQLFGNYNPINVNNSYNGFNDCDWFKLRAWRSTDGEILTHPATLYPDQFLPDPMDPGNPNSATCTQWTLSTNPIAGYDDPTAVFDFQPPAFAPVAVAGNITVSPYAPEDIYQCQTCYNEPQFEVSALNICIGDTVTVVNSTELGLRCHQYWDVEGPGLAWDSIPGSNDTLTLVLEQAGTVAVHLRSICGGPNSEYSVNLTVHEVEAQAFAPDPYSGYEVSCHGATDGSITEAAAGGYTETADYTWQWQSSNGTTVDTAGLGAGWYKGVVTDALGCSDTIQIELQAPTELAISAVVASDFNGFAVRCFDSEDGAVALQAYGGIPNYAFPAEGGFATNDTLTGLAAGVNFFSVVDANGCIALDTLVLSAPAPPLLVLTVDPDSCLSGEGALRADFAVDVSPATVIWPDGAGTPIPLTAYAERLEGLDQGWYEVELLDGNGCLTTLQVEVPATIPAEVEFLTGPREVCFPGADVDFLDMTSDSIRLRHWDFGDGTAQLRPGGDAHGADEAAHTYLSAGSFEVVLTVENGDGCVSESSAVVDVIDGMTVFVPSAFTPDNDGLNDGFGPVLGGVDAFHMWIFDRWGDVVFETDRMGWWWNGSPDNLGRSSKSEIFSWRLEAEGSCDAFKVYTGTVTLLR